MKYNFNVVSKGDYLHVTVQGDNTPQNVKDYLSEVLNACLKYGCNKVIIEENLHGPSLGTFDIFGIVANASKDPVIAKLQIAYMDVNKEHDLQGMRFAETVAVNRAINVRLFSDYGKAEQWLQNTK